MHRVGLPGSLRVALAVATCTCAAAWACGAASRSVEELIGFSRDAPSYWLVRGEVSRPPIGDQLRVRLEVVELLPDGTLVSSAPLALPPPPRRRGAGDLPDTDAIVGAARAATPGLEWGTAPSDAGLWVQSELRGDASFCRRQIPAEWRLRVGGRRQSTRVFQLPRDGKTRSRSDRLSPDGRLLVSTLRLDRATNWHLDDASHTRVIDLDAPPAAEGFWLRRSEGVTACRSHGDPCAPDLGAAACDEGLFCVRVGGQPRCAECRSDRDCDGRYCRDTATGRRCVACWKDAHCADDLPAGSPSRRPYCEVETNTCVACRQDAHCAGDPYQRPYCEVDTNTCAVCLRDSDCRVERPGAGALCDKLPPWPERRCVQVRRPPALVQAIRQRCRGPRWVPGPCVTVVAQPGGVVVGGVKGVMPELARAADGGLDEPALRRQLAEVRETFPLERRVTVAGQGAAQAELQHLADLAREAGFDEVAFATWDGGALAPSGTQ